MTLLAEGHDYHLGHIRVVQLDNGDITVQVAGRDVQFRNVYERVGSGFAVGCGGHDCALCQTYGPGPYDPTREAHEAREQL